MTLKILCGFSVHEIARGLLSTDDSVKKRIQRAKKKLADQCVQIEIPAASSMQTRIDAVHDVLYLMFNEGYSTSCGNDPVRDDICEEAARLCHVLCLHAKFSTSATKALLALMLFHAARLDSRTDEDGAAVLLEDQDRSLWDKRLISAAECWLARSTGSQPSKYHFEAVIAQRHCRATSVANTDWPMIVALYDRLIEIQDSPIYALNRAIARAQCGSINVAREELESIRARKELDSYYLLECAFARLHELEGETQKATDYYLAALAKDVAPHEAVLIKKKLAALQSKLA